MYCFPKVLIPSILPGGHCSWTKEGLWSLALLRGQGACEELLRSLQ